MKKKSVAIIAIIVLLLGLTGGYLYYENTTLQTTGYKIKSDKIPDGFDGYKIVQISDFHNTHSERLTNSLIEEIQKQEPDVIVLTGDFVDSRNTDIDAAISFVMQIKNFAPIYYVSGNHEARIDQFKELRERLEENAVTVLDNRAVALEQGGESIRLIGVDDPQMTHEFGVSDSEIMRTELE